MWYLTAQQSFSQMWIFTSYNKIQHKVQVPLSTKSKQMTLIPFVGEVSNKSGATA